MNEQLGKEKKKRNVMCHCEERACKTKKGEGDTYKRQVEASE